MASDRTLPQTGEDLRRAQDRSRQQLRPPTQVPGYEPERCLGAGAYGEVWVALDRNTGRRVAIKFYAHRGGLDWSLLSREVEKLAFLFADRYVVQLIDVGWEAEPPYYIMEYLERGSLEDRLQQGPLPVAQAVSLFRDVAIGLVHAHNKGVLHCDLKPANVLLDQDQRPRLADFGQSRLSHEQTPALGTLFYMAPEQADLAAVPDARWDVYALGALLYCMLTGEPPLRSEELVREIEEAETLTERLERYRQGIENAPRPTRHRQVAGVDRALAEIIERCLAVNPARRFANVQAVLGALEARAMQHARRPLLVFGVLGPALLLLIMSAYAWNVFNTVMHDSDRQLTLRALESNHFAARFVAETVATQIDRRWLTLEQEAADPLLRDLIRRSHEGGDDPVLEKDLQNWITAVARRHRDLNTTSWFVSDDTGLRLARYPYSSETQDKNFAFRDYFHGQGRSLPRDQEGIKPIEKVHRSYVFESKTTSNRMVGFSTPVWSGPVEDENRQVIGVLTMTVELGDFAELRPEPGSANEQIAVLVDTRQDEHGEQGSILEHPYLTELLRRNVDDQLTYHLPAFFLDEEHVRRFELLRQQEAEEERLAGPAPPEGEIDEQLELLEDYHDPVGATEPYYAGRWLAACEPVIVSGRPAGVQDTGWVVLVQERHGAATAPVLHLGQRLVRKGLWAFGIVVAVITLLWGLVIVVLTESSRSPWIASLRRSVGLSSPSLQSAKSENRAPELEANANLE